ncbi:uncharacterized protein AAG666_004834 isoform 1-T2 [Megaptera novaeangliae]
MTGQRAPRPLPLPRPPPRRPRPRLPAPEQESAAGRPDLPKGPEAGGARVPGPWGRTPSRRPPQVQSIDTAQRGEGAPSFSRARRPGSSGPRPSLASDPAPGRGAARAPALRREAAGAGKRGRWAGESGGAGCRGPGAEPRWRELVRFWELEEPKQSALDDTDSQVHTGPSKEVARQRLGLRAREERDENQHSLDSAGPPLELGCLGMLSIGHGG